MANVRWDRLVRKSKEYVEQVEEHRAHLHERQHKERLAPLMRAPDAGGARYSVATPVSGGVLPTALDDVRFDHEASSITTTSRGASLTFGMDGDGAFGARRLATAPADMHLSRRAKAAMRAASKLAHPLELSPIAAASVHAPPRDPAIRTAQLRSTSRSANLSRGSVRMMGSSQSSPGGSSAFKLDGGANAGSVSASWAERAKLAQARRNELREAQDAKTREAIWRRDHKDEIDDRGPNERMQAWMVMLKLVKFCQVCDQARSTAETAKREKMSKTYIILKLQILWRRYYNWMCAERDRRVLEAISQVTWKFRLACRVKKRLTARKQCVRFFRDFGYAQFAFVIYRFRHNVVRLQRFCRSFHQVTLARREALLLQWHRREKAALRAIETERRRARRNRNQQWKKVQLTEQAEHFPTLAEKIDGLTSEMAEHQRTVEKALAHSNMITAQIAKKSEASFDDNIGAIVCKMYLSERRRMHIRVMTDPQAYLKTTGGGSGGAANTELARQLITGSLSAESQIAKAANSSAPNADAGGSVKLSRWSPMLLLTGPCADIYDEVVQELVRAREHAHEVGSEEPDYTKLANGIIVTQGNALVEQLLSANSAGKEPDISELLGEAAA